MSDVGLPMVLYLSLHTALLSSVRYWLFRDALRIRVKWIYPLVTCLSLGSGLLWYVLKMEVGFLLWRTLMGALLFLLSCFIIKVSFFKHALPYSFLIAYNSTAELFSRFLYARLTNGTEAAEILISMAVVGASFIPVMRAIKRVVHRLMETGMDKAWGWLFVAASSFVLMNLFLTFPVPDPPPMAPVLSRMLMLLGVMGVLLATLRMAEAIRESMREKYNLMLAERQNALQQSHYERFVKQMEEIRRMRHDLRHHQTALAAMIAENDLEGLRQYTAAFPPLEAPLTTTGNMAIDSILLYNADRARAMGFQLESRIRFTQKPPVSDPDLCLILGNLLENALDAQEYLPADSRYVRVAICSDKSAFALAVDNRFDGTLLAHAGGYRSRKKADGHGLGLPSVRTACEQYGGVLQLETDGDLFLAGVVIER